MWIHKTSQKFFVNSHFVKWFTCFMVLFAVSVLLRMISRNILARECQFLPFIFAVSRMPWTFCFYPSIVICFWKESQFGRISKQTPTQLVLCYENHATSPLLFNGKAYFSDALTIWWLLDYLPVNFAPGSGLLLDPFFRRKNSYFWHLLIRFV